MSPKFIAETIFWLMIAAMVFGIYQAVILPGLRLQLRYRVFELRDKLRSLVVEGKIADNEEAFHLLHDQLNFVSCNLFRYDFARIAHTVSHMSETQREYVQKRIKIMESAPEEIRQIYKDSIDTVTFALVLNSLFFFVAASICLGIALLCRVGIKHVREAYRRRIEFDTRAALVLTEAVAVAV